MRRGFIMRDGNYEGEGCRTCAAKVETGVLTAAGTVPAAKTRTSKPFRADPTVWRLSVSAVLFIAAVIFGDTLRDTYLGWAEWLVFVPAYLLAGYPVLAGAFRDLIRGRLFNELFLMAIATIGAIALRQLPEAVGVMLFYAIGEYLQEKAVESSKKSIAGLLSLRPEFARVAEGDSVVVKEPEDVRVGDILEVRAGERFPLDGRIISGDSFADTSSLTGESVPRAIGPDAKILTGFVNDGGVVRMEVTALFGQSQAARILDLVEHAAARKAPTEKFMTKVAAVYTPFVVISAALLAVVPPLLIPGARFSDWLYRALVLLVISCPCALVISIPLGYFGGLGSASRNGILIKGANFLDTLLHVDTVVFDKTGTLTEGSFEVTSVSPAEGFSRDELLGFAAAAERFSPHPIAKAIVRAGENAASLVASEPRQVTEFKGSGVSADLDGRKVLAGNERFLRERGIPVRSADGTMVHVAVDGVYAGSLCVSDSIKAGARDAVRRLKERGVRKVIMLTGDRESAAKALAEAAGVDEYYSELLPEDKVMKFEAIKSAVPSGGNVLFVGDGMNDAPVLMRADVGIAMGGLGSDAAIEASDVVIMDDDIGRVPLVMDLAAATRRIVLQNIVAALGVKAGFLLLGAFGEAGMWEALIADVGVALLAVLNSLRAAGIRAAK